MWHLSMKYILMSSSHNFQKFTYWKIKNLKVFPKFQNKFLSKICCVKGYQEISKIINQHLSTKTAYKVFLQWHWLVLFMEKPKYHRKLITHFIINRILLFKFLTFIKLQNKPLSKKKNAMLFWYNNSSFTS